MGQTQKVVQITSAYFTMVNTQPFDHTRLHCSWEMQCGCIYERMKTGIADQLISRVKLIPLFLKFRAVNIQQYFFNLLLIRLFTKQPTSCENYYYNFDCTTIMFSYQHSLGIFSSKHVAFLWNSRALLSHFPRLLDPKAWHQDGLSSK